VTWGRESRGRAGGAGPGGRARCTRGEDVRGRSVGRVGVGRSVEPLGPGDGSLVHHTR
jgi:hypothetical protein